MRGLCPALILFPCLCGLTLRTSPGRFFAAAELKIIMAEMLLNYDVRLEGGGGRPENVVFGISVAPNPTARVMFRKRQL